MRDIRSWNQTETDNDPHRVDNVLWAVSAGVIYALTSTAANEFSSAAAAPAPIWVSDGIALAMLLLAPGRAHWPMYGGILLANIIVAMIAGVSLTATLIGSVANVVQAMIAVAAIRRITGLPVRLLNLRALTVFYLVAVVLAASLAALIQAAGAALLLGRHFTSDFITLYVSDALGVALMTPMLVSWGLFYVAIRDGRIAPLPFRPWRVLEGCVAFAGIAYTAWMVFATDFSQEHAIRPFVYMNLPCLVWVALRFDLRAVTAGLVVTSSIGAYYTLLGLGQFASPGGLQTSLLELQAFLMVLAVTIMVIAGLFNEHRVVANEMKNLHRRYDSVMRTSGSVVFEIDLATRRIVWMGDTREVLGWDAADIATVARWNEKVNPDDIGKLVGVRQRLASGEAEQVSLEYRIQRADGREIKLGIGAYGATYFDARRRESRRVIIGMAKDITEMAALAEENLKLDANLRQAQKMESIGQLAGGIAHDFNNILAAIIGYGEMARAKLDKQVASANTEESGKLVRYVDTILQAAERGRLLVSQILTFSRRAPEKRTAVELAGIVAEVATLLRGSFRHQVVLEIEARDVAVMGDPTGLHQLVMNICTNGMQAIEMRAASEPGFQGALSILLTETRLVDAPPDTYRALAPGRYALLCVDDDGIGMSEETRRRMFDPFFTTKSVGRGTGLGLSLAQAITHAHDGALRCASTPGQGTTFTIYLPVAEAAPENAPATDETPAVGQGERIMLVDDEAPLRDLAVELLTGLGYRPVAFEDPLAAWEAFNAAPHTWDLLLTDEVMPGLTGTELATRLHQVSPAMPILIITAYGGAGFQLRAEAAGVTRVMKKPYRPEELASALADALRPHRKPR